MPLTRPSFSRFLSQIRELFKNWPRLLYWVFFKPTTLRDYLRQITPELLVEDSTSLGRAFRAYSNALAVTVLTPFIVDIAFGWFVMAIGGHFNWTYSLFYVTLTMMVGAAGFIKFDVVFGMAISVVFGIILGVAGGLVDFVVVGVPSVVAFGIAIGIVVDLMVGLVGGVVIGIVIGLTVYITIGPMAGMATAIVVSLGTLRIPFYIFEVLLALHKYRRSQYSENLSLYFEQSPVYFDDLLILPQPYLASFLILISRTNLSTGLKYIMHVANNPFQRWAAQQALRVLLEQDKVSFFHLIHSILTTSATYFAIGNSNAVQIHAIDTYFIPKILLAELAGLLAPAKFLDIFPRLLTTWLRLPGKSMYAPLAKAYFDLLNKTTQSADILSVFEHARKFKHDDEIYHTFSIANAALRCQSFTQIARCKQEFTPLFIIEVPLRPKVITVFHCLNDAATDATAFLAAEHPQFRQEVLFKAFSVLEIAKKEAEHVYEPEQSILLEVIKQWRVVFEDESRRDSMRVEVPVLPNPYIAGRALNPNDGKLFVGRREVFRKIEETLQTGVTIVLYGQRRIGKTSILMRLHEHLSHSFLPVYLDLQRMQADTTAGLFFALAQKIANHLRTARWSAQVTPDLNAFVAEPFLTFNTFLHKVESGLASDQRVVLAFDEFEGLEKQVNAGRIDQRIFGFLRSVTQTGRGFVLVFAGLHTLEQMTHDYWHPFFLSAKPLKISYFSETEMWQLITDPMDEFPLQYDGEAIERIIAVTHGQPYLVQDLCHNLVTYLNDPLHRSNRATVQDVNDVLERTLESGTYYFKDYVWGWSNEHELLTLAAIADEKANTEGGWVTFTTIEKHLGREIALATVKNLCARDILEERAVGKILEYRFQVELLRLWVARTQPLVRILLEQGKC